MQTVFEHIREHLLKKAGVIKEPVRILPPIAELRKSEWSPRFEQLMRNRLIMGAFRYELFGDKSKSFEYDIVGSVEKRLQKYKETHNMEHLIDIANLMLLEFEFGKHPDKHFSPIDDGEHTEKKERDNA